LETLKHNEKILMIRRGFTVGLPIMIGYLPIALAYGVLAKQAGLSLLEVTLMSVMVFAGASQFMGANMIAVSASAVEIIVATFVLNFRHFIMSLSFMNLLRPLGLNVKVPLALGLTDESFAVSSLHPEKAKEKNGVLFYLTIFITAYISWIAGSFLGGLIGDIIPNQLSQSMGIALYAMFIGLLIPSVKKNLKVGLIALVAMLINVLFSQFMTDGWAIVFGTVLGGLSGLLFLRGKNE